jgi:putative hydrolase of the HAD superfamily
VTAPVRAALFDLGGVVLESPLHFISQWEAVRGLPAGLVARLVGGYASQDGSWQMLERGELPLADFCARFDEELHEAGTTISTLDMMREMSRHTVIRDDMLAAIRRLRAAGFTVGALTNNWETGDEQDGRLDRLRAEFHVFVESCKVGMRKPEERIFEHACSELELEPADVVFLDDIGANLKVARRLGMTTIKVGDPADALRELGGVVGIELVGAGG